MEAAKEERDVSQGKQGDVELGKRHCRGPGRGKFTDKVTRKIAGKSITRNADKDNPAYMVVQEDGAKALKSESELSKA